MSGNEAIEFEPPYLHPDYRSTVLRAPGRPLVRLPQEWFDRAAGPAFGRIPVKPEDADLTRQHHGEPLGERIILSGRVVDGEGAPVRDTLVEVWQANSAGRYADPADEHRAPLDPNFTGAGRCRTDHDGRYRFVTIKPGAYPWQNHDNAWRPAHVHFSLFGPHLSSRCITQMYFPGDPLMRFDPILNSIPDPRGRELLVASFDLEATEPEWALAYRWDIVVRGARDAAGGLNPVAGRRSPTPSQTVGPFFGFALPFAGDSDAVSPGHAGVHRIEGQVIDGAGEPVADSLIEMWHGEQFARCRTDAEGAFHFTVRKPPAARLPDGRVRAPHLNVTVLARGLLRHLATFVYFPEEVEANLNDPILELVEPSVRETLIARRDGQVLRFDIHLQGDGETAFFA